MEAGDRGGEMAADGTAPWLRRWGISAWMLIGIGVLASFVYGAMATLSGLVAPLVVAAVVGILASPVVDGLHRYRVPRPLGAVVVILGLIGAIVGSVAISVRGVIDQGDEISEQLTAGIDAVNEWLTGVDLDLGDADERLDQASDVGIDWISGLASYATTIFSGLLAFVVGTFLGLFFMYYVLADWHRLRAWVGRSLPVPDDLGAGIVDDVTSMVRSGFYALSASSLVTAVLIGLTMVMLDLPLAFTVALVTFVTSYIPYLGAIFSGTFGFLVALGAGGTTQALILLVVILVVQNVVQTVVGNRLISSSLSLHPIAGLISTIVGASLAGLLGAMLSAPALAAIIAIRRRVVAYQPAVTADVAMAANVSEPIGGGDG